jgi:hypothetical protein
VGYFKKRPVRMLLVLIIASAATVILAETPAFAAGSVIDIGYTIYSGGYVKGSGSDTNNGDWTNVCIAIMSQNISVPLSGSTTDTVACNGALGSHTWSAPDYYQGSPPQTFCLAFWTRITAYTNGVKKANKDSNTILVGHC